jgi:hypothetical protein
MHEKTMCLCAAVCVHGDVLGQLQLSHSQLQAQLLPEQNSATANTRVHCARSYVELLLAFNRNTSQLPKILHFLLIKYQQR